MKKFLELINIPRQIKQYFLRRKIDKYRDKTEKETNKYNWVKIINFLILIFLIGTLTYFNLKYESRSVFLSSLGIVIAGVIIFSVKKMRSLKKDKVDYQIINKLSLKEEGTIIEEWDLKDKTALLVGKKEEGNNIDIDLATVNYASLISREHGVLNNAGNKWYFEDLNSLNGSGIRRKHNNKKFKVPPGEPYKLNAGDTLYIANTKLIIQ